MLYHALKSLCAQPRIERVWVVLAPGDAHWGRHDWRGIGSQLAVLFAGGVAWSWLYVRYGSIWPGYLSHAIVDVAVFGTGAALLFG